MNWIILIIAGLCEVGFSYCLGRAKFLTGTAWMAWMLGFIIFTIFSMALLAKATQTLPIGTVVIGILFFEEPFTLKRLFFISTLIISIIGLKCL